MKIVHLNLPPLPVETAREYLAPLGAELISATCVTREEVVAVAHDADAIIGAGFGRIIDRDCLRELR